MTIFCHPWDSFCHTGNTDAEENGTTEYSLKSETPAVEFFDAWEGTLALVRLFMISFRF